MSWRAALRRPAGQLQLLAFTLIGAAVFAAWMGQQQAFFDDLVREKYGQAMANEAQTAAALVTGDAQIADLEPAYRHWMRGNGGRQDAQALAAHDPTWTLARVERTLVAGTVAQRRRALALLVLARPDGTQALIRAVLDRTRRMGPPELLPDLEAAVAAEAP